MGFFSLRHCIHTGFVVHPVSFPGVPEAFLLRSEGEAEHLSASSVES